MTMNIYSVLIYKSNPCNLREYTITYLLTYLYVLVSLRKSNLIDCVFFQYLNVNFLLATNSQLNFLSCEQLS